MKFELTKAEIERVTFTYGLDEVDPMPRGYGSDVPVQPIEVHVYSGDDDDFDVIGTYVETGVRTSIQMRWGTYPDWLVEILEDAETRFKAMTKQ